jgi:hypothetical protein
MRHTSVLIVVSLLAFARIAPCEESSPRIPSDLILERFAVSKNGDPLLVPVTVAQKKYLFVVDTGATITVFDTSIHLGQQLPSRTVDGADGKAEIKMYQSPEARVGGTLLGPLEAVGGMDFNHMREVSGLHFYGLLGMDFLSRYVVHIDIEKGELLILKSAPKNAGVEVPVSLVPGYPPFVGAEFGAEERIRFLVDTGHFGFDSGDLGIFETRSLLKKGHLKKSGESVGESISGARNCSHYQAGALRVGDFTVRSPIFSESFGPQPNNLGLRFWSRFVATFDFPERKLYLRKSGYFDRPERVNRTGLSLCRKGNETELSAVDSDSPAARAGLKKGDVLVELNGMNAAEVGLLALYSILCDDDKLTCVVRRDSQERRMSINQGK